MSAVLGRMTFTDRKSGTTTTVAYADVVEVKKPGLSTGAKIAIAVGIGVGVLAVLTGGGAFAQSSRHRWYTHTLAVKEDIPATIFRCLNSTA
jgi:hypothetical protein